MTNIGTVHESALPQLGIVGRDNHDDVVEGMVLMRKGENPGSVLPALEAKVDYLNNTVLPADVKIKVFYDRTELNNHTLHTVGENVFMGRVLDDGSGQLPLVRSAQFAASVKWGLFFVTTALLGAYLAQRVQIQFKLIGLAYLLSGLTGLLGSLAVFSGRIYPKAFEWPVPVIFLATILFAVLLLSQPQRFAGTAPTN